MKYIDILNKIQTELLSLQSSLNELRCLDGSSTCDVYITRQSRRYVGQGTSAT